MMFAVAYILLNLLAKSNQSMGYVSSLDVTLHQHGQNSCV